MQCHVITDSFAQEKAKQKNRKRNLEEARMPVDLILPAIFLNYERYYFDYKKMYN